LIHDYLIMPDFILNWKGRNKDYYDC